MLAAIMLTLALAAQEPSPVTEAAVAAIESCVDGGDATSQCPGLDIETAVAALCVGSSSTNGTLEALTACLSRAPDQCLDGLPTAPDRDLYARWCVARARGGLSNAIALTYESWRRGLPSAGQARLHAVYAQAAADRNRRAREATERGAQGFAVGALRFGMLASFAHQMNEAARHDGRAP